jgi:hypothetical protein
MQDATILDVDFRDYPMLIQNEGWKVWGLLRVRLPTSWKGPPHFVHLPINDLPTNDSLVLAAYEDGYLVLILSQE